MQCSTWASIYAGRNHNWGRPGEYAVRCSAADLHGSDGMAARLTCMACMSVCRVRPPCNLHAVQYMRSSSSSLLMPPPPFTGATAINVTVLQASNTCCRFCHGHALRLALCQRQSGGRRVRDDLRPYDLRPSTDCNAALGLGSGANARLRLHSPSARCSALPSAGGRLRTASSWPTPTIRRCWSCCRPWMRRPGWTRTNYCCTCKASKTALSSCSTTR